MTALKPAIALIHSDERDGEQLAASFRRRDYAVTAYRQLSDFRAAEDPSVACVLVFLRRPALADAHDDWVRASPLETPATITSPDSPPKIVVSAPVIRSPADSERTVAEQLVGLVEAQLAGEQPTLSSAADLGLRFERLSPGQRRVLRGLLQGRTVKEIAVILGLSPQSVSRYRAALRLRFGVTNDVQLYQAVFRHPALRMMRHEAEGIRPPRNRGNKGAAKPNE